MRTGPDEGDRRHVVGHATPQLRWAVFGAALAIMLIVAGAVTLSPAAAVVQDLTLIDHIGALCLLAFSKLLSPVHRLFEVAIAAGLVMALVDRFRAWREAHRLVQAVESSPPTPGSPLHQACHAAGLPPGKLLRVVDSPIPAFTIGALKPIVVINDKLEEMLTRDELVAVLAHESEHVRRRDPLRLSSMRFVVQTLFFLPALRALEAHMAEEAELRADKVAAGKSGIATASALLTLVRKFGRVGNPAMSTGLSHHEFIALRVHLLAGQNAAAFSRVSTSALLTTMAVLTLLWTAALAELHEATHKQHIATAEEECRQHSLPALSGLVCLPDGGTGNKTEASARHDK